MNIPNAVLLLEVERLLNDGKDVVLLAKGVSMQPFIVGGRDSVRLRKAEKIHAGDIVLARVGVDKYVLHRVVKVSGCNVSLMGDGNVNCTKESCRSEDVLGTVLEIIGPDGHVRKPGRAAIWRLTGPRTRRILVKVCNSLISRLN